MKEKETSIPLQKDSEGQSKKQSHSRKLSESWRKEGIRWGESNHEPTAASTLWCGLRSHFCWVEMVVDLPEDPSYPGHNFFFTPPLDKDVS